MNTIKETFKKIFSSTRAVFSKTSYEKSSVEPVHDWHYIIFAFFAGIISIAIFALYVYGGVQEGKFWTVSIPAESNQVYTINQKDLHTITSYFQTKATNLQNNPPAVPDPSL